MTNKFLLIFARHTEESDVFLFEAPRDALIKIGDAVVVCPFESEKVTTLMEVVRTEDIDITFDLDRGILEAYKLLAGVNGELPRVKGFYRHYVCEYEDEIAEDEDKEAEDDKE